MANRTFPSLPPACVSLLGHTSSFSQQSPGLLASPFSLPKRSWVSRKLNITAKLLQQGQSWAKAGDSPEQTVAPELPGPRGPDAAAPLGSALLVNLTCGTLCCHAFLTLLHMAVIPSAIQMEGSTMWAALATRRGMQPLKIDCLRQALSLHPPTQTYTLSQIHFTVKVQYLLKKNMQSLTGLLSKFLWTFCFFLNWAGRFRCISNLSMCRTLGFCRLGGWWEHDDPWRLKNKYWGGITPKQHAAFIHTSGIGFIQMGRKSSWPKALTSINAGFPVHMAVPFKELWQWYCL